MRSAAVLAPASAIELQLAPLMDRARTVLGLRSGTEQDQLELHRQLGSVPLRLVQQAAPGDDGSRSVELAGLAGALQGQLRDQVRISWSAALQRLHGVLGELARDASPTELIAAGPAAVCRACNLDRALISRVEGSNWVPGVLHEGLRVVDDGGDGLGSFLAESTIPLTAKLLETDMVRRRVPILVQDAQSDERAYRPLVDAGRTRSYVAAPIVVDNRVIGMFHADAHLSGRVLTRVDRDLLQRFADGFARAYEQAALAERIARQRDQIRQAFSSVELSLGQFDPSAVRFSRTPVPSQVPSVSAARTASEARCDETLTTREREILALLATGATNLQIAARLVVSESTVKSHVKRILRKLPAANRAEAVYVYLRLTEAQERRA